MINTSRWIVALGLAISVWAQGGGFQSNETTPASTAEDAGVVSFIGPDRVRIQLVDVGDDGEQAFVARESLSAGAVRVLSALSNEDWVSIFAIYVGLDDEGLPAVVGKYQAQPKSLRFTPRYPLADGVSYRAELDRARLRELLRSKGIDISTIEMDPNGYVVTFVRSPVVRTPTTVLEQIYPSSDLLPENQLKFYLHFSAPMSRGLAYENLRLLREDGSEVILPFLELDEELWDRDGKRFTVFIDPGRIKRGVLPREQVGPAFRSGQHYTLEVDSDWRDATGTSLKNSHRKTFLVGPPDLEAPDPKSWSIDTPKAKSLEPVRIHFGESLDHALAHRLLWIYRADGTALEGQTTVTHDETRWAFTPTDPWRAEEHQLRITTTLEDLAGNSVGKTFEVDLFEPVQKRIVAKTVSLPIVIGGRQAD